MHPSSFIISCSWKIEKNVEIPFEKENETPFYILDHAKVAS